MRRLWGRVKGWLKSPVERPTPVLTVVYGLQVGFALGAAVRKFSEGDVDHGFTNVVLAVFAALAWILSRRLLKVHTYVARAYADVVKARADAQEAAKKVASARRSAALNLSLYRIALDGCKCKSHGE